MASSMSVADTEAFRKEAPLCIFPALDFGSTLDAGDLPSHPPSGRKLRGGILSSHNLTSFIVNIRPPRWKDSIFWIRTENYQVAQYIADAVRYYTGRGPFYFCDSNFQYPPLRLDNRELLTREMCLAYVKSIARGPGLQNQREDYRERVKQLVLKAVKSSEVVLFLNPVVRPETNLEAIEDEKGVVKSCLGESCFSHQGPKPINLHGEKPLYGNEGGHDQPLTLNALGVDLHDRGDIVDDGNEAASFLEDASFEDKSQFVGLLAEAAGNAIGDKFTEFAGLDHLNEVLNSSMRECSRYIAYFDADNDSHAFPTELYNHEKIDPSWGRFFGSGDIEDRTTPGLNRVPEAKRFGGVQYNRRCRRWMAVGRPSKNKHKVFFGDFKSQAQAALAVDAAFHHYGMKDLINFTDTPQILSSRPTPGLTEENKLKFVKEEAKWLASMASRLLSTSFTSPSTREHDALPSVNSSEIPESSRGCTAVTLGFDSFSETSSPSTFGDTDQHVGGVEPALHLFLKRSDVYSFAMTCYEVLTGKHPFSGIEDGEPMKQIEARVRPEFSLELDEDLKGVIAKCSAVCLVQDPKFEDICHLLDYIRFRKGVVHRDIKAGNVLVNEHPGRYISVKLTDFGIAKDLDSSLGIVGTRFWRAPEILRAVKTAGWPKERDVFSAAADVYSYGMMCYAILTGKLPFVGSVGVGGIGKTTLANYVWKNLKRAHGEEIKENRYAKSYLQKGRYTRRKALLLLDHIYMGTESNLEACASKSLVPLADPYMGPEMPESVFGVKLSILSDDEPARKRIRTRNWSAEEIRTMLELMEEALRVDEGPEMIWEYVSENLWDQYGFDRASNSCENLWFSLVRSYKAVRDHESKIRAFTKFDSECGDKVERILIAKPFEDSRNIQMDRAGLPSSALPLCRFQSSARDISHLPTDSANCDEVLYDELTDSEMEEFGSESEDEGSSGDTTATLESQAGFTVGSHVPRTKQSHEPSCFETNSNYASRKRSAATVIEDDLISRIVPFVTKQIEDALKPLLSVLRSREDKQKHR